MGQHDGFRSLQVWQRSKDLAVSIYTLTREGTIARDFGLIDQIRRAAVSIPSNIAEGDERQTNKESVQFFYIAKGSLAELRTQLEIARHVGYITRETWQTLDDECGTIGRMLGALIKSRSTRTHSP
jgi:four helix bundle protein